MKYINTDDSGKSLSMWAKFNTQIFGREYMNNKDTEAPERDRLVKKFAYEYVRFNHDPNHCYLVTDVTDDCMLEIEGMSGQFAPSCFNLAPQPKQEPTVGADGRYCAHHDDDPAHTEECYEVEYARVDPPAAPIRLWHAGNEPVSAGEEIIAVHGPTFSIGRKHEFDAVGLSIDAWCTRRELIASSQSAPPAPDERDKAVAQDDDDLAWVAAIAMPWICVEAKPCEETVAVHWSEMLTAMAAALAQARKEAVRETWEKAIGIADETEYEVPQFQHMQGAEAVRKKLEAELSALESAAKQAEEVDQNE